MSYLYIYKLAALLPLDVKRALYFLSGPRRRNTVFTQEAVRLTYSDGYSGCAREARHTANLYVRGSTQVFLLFLGEDFTRKVPFLAPYCACAREAGHVASAGDI